MQAPAEDQGFMHSCILHAGDRKRMKGGLGDCELTQAAAIC